MALVQLSGNLEDINGSIGNLAYAHVRAGIVSKKKSYPGSVNPFTPSARQVGMRDEFRIIADKWKTLLQTQRDGWDALAKTIIKQNPFNKDYHPSGFTLYIELNHNMQLIGRSIYDDAPVKPTVIGLAAFKLVTSLTPGQQLKIDFGGQTSNAQTVHLVYASPGCSPGVRYCRNQYRLVSLIPPATSNYYYIDTGYFNYFTTPGGWSKIFIKLISIEKNTGFTGISTFNYNFYPGTYNQIGFSHIGLNFIIG